MGGNLAFYQELGNRLRKAREALGMTQTEVARSLGLNNYQSYSAIEKGERDLKAWELSRLAKAFNVTIDYLLGSEEPASERPEILWRARRDSEASKQVEQEFIRFCGYYDLLEKKAGVSPSTNFVPESAGEKSGFNFDKAQKLAEQYWKRLDMGSRPAYILDEMLEQILGVRIFQFRLGDAGSGASTISRFGPSILINADEAPWRRNFNLAHEFFHLVTWNLFDRSKIHCDDAGTKKSKYEQWADSFASALLLPKKHVREELEKRVKNKRGNVWDCVELSRYFGVSLDAFLWRLVTLKMMKRESVLAVLERPEVKELDREARRSDWVAPKKFSNRYVFLAIKCLQRGLISRSKFAEFCDIDIADVSNFLSEYGIREEEPCDFELDLA
ncbi:MAG: helix-turn-helix domain-containing protein [Candidatus Abyssobacteria bacterium SURF_17]|uniref:Helix-turn-helix domain-containing protein n=1 Tax=Candidatus Abyssobacteria bacterium SURF_17 TaxID=2093361 RepID=A0A419F694_9BACT|nr:MAG: helix-turn-helix domain-containing protein [Candidatus Abyssubacteria bacterium SURF_17]